MEVCELSNKEYSELFFEVGAFIYCQVTITSYELCAVMGLFFEVVGRKTKICSNATFCIFAGRSWNM